MAVSPSPRTYAEVASGFSPNPNDYLMDLVYGDEGLEEAVQVFEDGLLPLDEHLNRPPSPPPLLRQGEPHPPPLEPSPPTPPPPRITLEVGEDLASLYEPVVLDPPPLRNDHDRSLWVENAVVHYADATEVLRPHVMPSFSASTLPGCIELCLDESSKHDFAVKRRRSREVAEVPGRVARKHYITMACILNGDHVDRLDPSARRRAPTTRLTRCPYAFKIHLVFDDDGNERYAVAGHVNGIVGTTHNHPPLQRGTSYQMRRLPRAIVDEICTLTLSAMAPIEIYGNITRLHPVECESLLLSDIYRLRRHSRARQLCGTPTSEYLRRFLEDEEESRGLLWKIDQCRDTSRLLGLVWSTSTARALLHRFPGVLFIDVTYDSDRYGHKLLHIGGFTATNQTFTVALAAMPDETEETVLRYLQYFQVLMGHFTPRVVVVDRAFAIRNAVGAVWSSEVTKIIFCAWHVFENLRTAIAEAVAPYRRAAPKRPKPTEGAEATQTATQATEATQQLPEVTDDTPDGPLDGHPLLIVRDGRILDKDDWDAVKVACKTDYIKSVVRAQTQIEYQNGLEAWLAKYEQPIWGTIFATALDKGVRYADEDGHGFIHALVNRYLHFGQLTTSRLEAIHAILRRFIGSRAQSGKLTIDRLVLYSLDRFLTQWNTVRAEMHREKSRRPALNAQDVTHSVRTLVSEHAINKISAQVSMARNIVARVHGETHFDDGREIPEVKPCTGQFRGSLGLPCSHEIAKVIDTRNGGAGILNILQFHSQWWLTSAAQFDRLLETVNEAVVSGCGVVRIDPIDPPGQGRLLDPLPAAARRAVAAARPRRPQAATQRVLTQAEVVDGVVRQPVARCPFCRRRHGPGGRPCRQALEAHAEANAEGSANAEDSANAATDASASQGRRGRAREPIDFATIDLDRSYLTCRAAEVDGCPFCPKNHTRKWCKAMYDWRKWWATREPVEIETADQASSPQAASEVSEVSALAGLQAYGSETEGSDTEVNDSDGTDDDAVVGPSVPGTPTRTPARLRNSPSLSLSLDDIFDWADRLRTQRLGSIHHEYVAEQPSQTPNSQTPNSQTPLVLVPETQPVATETVSDTETNGGREPSVGEAEAEGAAASLPSSPSPPKRPRHSPRVTRSRSQRFPAVSE